MNSTPNSRTIKALLVDDEEVTLDLLIDMFRAIGLESIITANNGKSALKLALDEEPDIVFTDYVMPGIDGVMLMQAIRAISPKTPVVLFTGFLDELMKKLKEAGDIKPDYILLKPFVSTDKIISILRKHFPLHDFGEAE